MQKIDPFLWFDNKAEEAANYYVSLFKNSKIENISRYDKEGAKASGVPEGSVMTVAFQIEGQRYIALNGGKVEGFTFSPAISFLVHCQTQEEVDNLWEKLSEGGKTNQCGWLTDKFGLTWQIVPDALNEMLSDPNPEKAQRVMKAMLQMTKIDINALKQAYEKSAPG